MRCKRARCLASLSHAVLDKLLNDIMPTRRSLSHLLAEIPEEQAEVEDDDDYEDEETPVSPIYEQIK